MSNDMTNQELLDELNRWKKRADTLKTERDQLRACLPQDRVFMDNFRQMVHKKKKLEGDPCAVCGFPTNPQMTPVFGVAPQWNWRSPGKHGVAHLACDHSIHRHKGTILELALRFCAATLKQIREEGNISIGLQENALMAEREARKALNGIVEGL